MKIDIEHFTKKLHGRIVLDDVNLHFDSGDKGLVVGLVPAVKMKVYIVQYDSSMELF